MKLTLLLPLAAFVAPRVAAVIPLSSINLEEATLPIEYIVELESSHNLEQLAGQKRASSVGNFSLFLIS